MEKLLLSSFYALGRSPFGIVLGRKTRAAVSALTYHRVLPESEHVQELSRAGLSVSTSAFEEQISWLAEKCRCLSLDALVAGHFSIRDTNVVVTFDDGYRDNLIHAYPVLKYYRVPFAVYSTTRFLEGDATMWWYEIPEILATHQQIEFNWRGQPRRLPLTSSRAKRHALRRIRAALLRCDAAQQFELLELLRGGKRPRSYEQLCLSAEEVKQLAQDPLCTIGAHTVNHYVLANLDDQKCKSEMEESKKFLERLLDHPVDHFAYPFGGRQQAGPREFDLARKVGFKTAVTTTNRPLKLTPETMVQLQRQPVRWLTNANDLRGKLNGWSTLWRVSG